MSYSSKFKNRMVAQLTGPGAKTVSKLSKEVGLHQSTLSRWLRDAKQHTMIDSTDSSSENSPLLPHRRWTSGAKVGVVRRAMGLGEKELGPFLRREGLHEADLQRIREEVMEAAAEGLDSRSRNRGKSPEAKRIRILEKELRRKEKALAETAALLVLQGKLEAFLDSEGEEGDTSKRSGR